jgi:hypothetical protein
MSSYRCEGTRPTSGRESRDGHRPERGNDLFCIQVVDDGHK